MSTNGHGQKWKRPSRRLLLILAVVAIAAVAAGVSVLATSGSSANTASSPAVSSRFASLQSCLRKEGINLPGPSDLAGRPRAGSGGQPGHFNLPEGVSQSKFREALKNCGGGGFPRGEPRSSSGASS